MTSSTLQDGAGTDRLVFSFDEPPAGDRAGWAAVLGGKGAGLARMRQLGLPVPPGFTLPTSVCNRVSEGGWFPELDSAIESALDDLERSMGRHLGSPDEPLLVSVRSGAPVSMPGMMDTVLNVGMSESAAEALGRWARDERFGWDTYRRFLDCYASIVVGVGRAELDALRRNAANDLPVEEMTAGDLAGFVTRFATALAAAGHEIPADGRVQIRSAIEAVFRSCNADRAITYREREGLPADLGTAATVQAMVFGNLGSRSGTGVVFTRDPSTGDDGLMGDFLVGGQGEDVVAGTHRTQPIADLARTWPAVADQLARLATQLEHELGDVADIEFTVENDVLWLLQARVGKRSPQAALRLAVRMADDPSFPLSRAEAVARVADLLDDPPTVASNEDADDEQVLATGLAASPGRAVGVVSVDADDALRRGEHGEAVVLVRPETSPADVHGMAVAQGLVTTLGGLVSHAAVVARSWGIPAVVGVEGLQVASDGIVAGTVRIGVGELITVDGNTGSVLVGAHAGGSVEMPETHVLRAWQAELGLLGEQASTIVRSAASPVTADDCLRALGLKGMATAEAVASLLGTTADSTAQALGTLVESGTAQAGPGDRFMLTPDGSAAVDAIYEAEARTAQPVIEPHLERFHQLNQRFKEIVTSWQMREVNGEAVMNDHADADYDRSVLEALRVEIHTGILTIVDAVSEAVPRIGVYRERLDAALDGVEGGDLELMAHPLRDSYHTVWFELHEELIRLSGRNRADEAAAGRA